MAITDTQNQYFNRQKEKKSRWICHRWIGNINFIIILYFPGNISGLCFDWRYTLNGGWKINFEEKHSKIIRRILRLSDRFQIKNWINFVLLKFRICDEDFFWNRNLVFLWNLCTLYVNLRISYLRVHDLYHRKSEKFKCIFLDRPHNFKYFSWPSSFFIWNV